MRSTRGFTLIEVMITVAIVAILAAIAVPSYSNYIRRARLSETLAVLSGMRVKMEQFFQDNRTYNGACGLAGSSVAPAPTNTTNFTYACVPSGVGVVPSTYVITATGIGTMAGFVYTMNEANVRNTTAVPSGWSGANTGCWVTKQDGSC